MLRLNAMWALVALYAIGALRFGLDGELFIGIAVSLGALAGVQVSMGRIAAARLETPEKPPTG